jgi:hypothetical protein
MTQLISNPILLMGGTGAIGRLSARALRTAYPDVPLLIGGRDLVKSRQVASEIGQTEGVVIDPRADDLGLGDRRVRAVAVFYADERLAGLRFAQGRRVPHLSISSGVNEIAPEVASYMHSPNAAAIVPGRRTCSSTLPRVSVRPVVVAGPNRRKLSSNRQAQ